MSKKQSSAVQPLSELALPLDLKSIAHSMEEVAVEFIQTHNNEVMSRWLHSEKDADLFIWQDDHKNIIKQGEFLRTSGRMEYCRRGKNGRSFGRR